MGDMSAEPSMEDILASIKRVIKEGETQAPPRRMSPRPIAPPLSSAPAPVAQDDEEDEVLELNQPIAQAPAPVPAPAPIPPAPSPPSVSQAAPEPRLEAPARAGVSPATAEATRDALGALSRLVVKPEPGADGTLEGLVRDMLRPMLSDWLDANLPGLVEDMVAREIAKITDAPR